MQKSRISKGEVAHIAWLAKIELSQKEQDAATKQFHEILGFFQKIDEAETAGVPPTFHVLDLVNAYRKDEVASSLSKEEALKNAPKKERGFLKAPRIV